MNAVIQSLNIQTFCGINSTKAKGLTKSGLETKRECVQGVTVGSSEKRFLEAGFERVGQDNDGLTYFRKLKETDVV